MIGAPAFWASARDAYVDEEVQIEALLKSTLLTTSPMGGMTTSFTNELTIFPNTPPMMTATARSSTFP